MPDVLLIRHGQTDANAAGVVQGHLPTPLNAIGRVQSQRVGKHLAARTPPVTRLLTSPLARAIQTAEIIAGHLGIPATPDQRWVERHFGSQQGQPMDLNRIMTHGGNVIDPHDAEPRQSFDRRVAVALGELADGADVIAIVTHGGVIGSVVRQLISGALPCVNPPAERKPIPNGAILHLRWQTYSWRLCALLETRHLDGLETVLDAG